MENHFARKTLALFLSIFGFPLPTARGFLFLKFKLPSDKCVNWPNVSHPKWWALWQDFGSPGLWFWGLNLGLSVFLNRQLKMLSLVRHSKRTDGGQLLERVLFWPENVVCVYKCAVCTVYKDAVLFHLFFTSCKALTQSLIGTKKNSFVMAFSKSGWKAMCMKNPIESLGLGVWCGGRRGKFGDNPKTLHLPTWLKQNESTEQEFTVQMY